MPEAIDRYPVDPQNGPAQFAEALREIERRIAALEGAPMVGSNFTSRDGTNDRAIAGKLDTAGTHYGIRVPSTGAYDAFYVDERGMDTPQFPLPQNFVPDGVPSYVSVAAGAGWTLVARTLLPSVIAHAALRMFAGWSFTDGSTTGQFRLLSVVGVASALDTVLATSTGPVLGAGSDGTARLDWLHQLPLGTEAATFDYFDLEAQVVSGSGDLLCYEPSVTLMNDSHGATTSGVWATFS